MKKQKNILETTVLADTMMSMPLSQKEKYDIAENWIKERSVEPEEVQGAARDLWNRHCLRWLVFQCTKNDDEMRKKQSDTNVPLTYSTLKNRPNIDKKDLVRLEEHEMIHGNKKWIPVFDEWKV